MKHILQSPRFNFWVVVATGLATTVFILWSTRDQVIGVDAFGGPLRTSSVLVVGGRVGALACLAYLVFFVRKNRHVA